MLPFKRYSKIEQIPKFCEFKIHNYPIKYSKYLSWSFHEINDKLKIDFLEKEHDLYKEILKDMDIFRINRVTNHAIIIPTNDLNIFNYVILPKYNLNTSYCITIYEISRFEIFYSDKTSKEYARYIMNGIRETDDQLLKKYKEDVDIVNARNNEISQSNDLIKKENYDIMQFNNNFQFIFNDCSMSLKHNNINYKFNCNFNNKNSKCSCRKHSETEIPKRKYQYELDDIDSYDELLDGYNLTDNYHESPNKHNNYDNILVNLDINKYVPDEKDKPSDDEESSNFIKRTNNPQLNNNTNENELVAPIKRRTINFKRKKHLHQ
jgi:hypothetical protein